MHSPSINTSLNTTHISSPDSLTDAIKNTTQEIHHLLQDDEIFPGITSYQLARRIGNLFYDALWEFLRMLSDRFPNDELIHHALQDACPHIEKAWKLCKGKDENHPIHTRHVPEIEQSLEEIAQGITELSHKKQSEFFYHLSQKLQRDAHKDEKRGRVQLAGELFASSESIGKIGKNESE